MRHFTVVDVEQGSHEWHAARCGRFTASRASDAFARTKTAGEAAKRRDYRTSLVLERLTGVSQDDSGFVSADMKRGHEIEPLARAAYEARTGTLVSEVGFCSHITLMAGASPDAVLGDFEGLAEFKAPRSANHLQYLRNGLVPKEHEAQLLALLWLTGAQWVDFFSYDPLMPESLQGFLVRMERREPSIAAFEADVKKFLAEVDAEQNEVAEMARKAAA